MRLYELTYLISPDLSEEDLKNFNRKVKNFIQEEEGFLESSSKENPLRKKLGYPIKKKVRGYLSGFDFRLNPGKLPALEKKLKSESPLLRYILVTKKISKKIPEEKIFIPKVSLQKKIIKPEKKVELKEIEKKLEEILGQ